MPHRATIGLAIDSITAQRLSRGMFQRFRSQHAFHYVDIYRPLPEVVSKIASWRARVLVTRWAPGISDAVLGLGVPTVLIGGYKPHARTICVGVDNEEVGAAAARHLLDRGHTQFAFVGKAYPFVKARERGFVSALRQAGHHCAIHRENGRWDHYLEDWPHADNALARWLRDLPKPVGLFGAQDTSGWQVLQLCASIGLRVPEDVTVVAANNDELACSLAQPPLSSVSIPWDKIGEEVAAAAERLLARPRPSRAQLAPVRIPPDGVVIRQSSNLLAVSQPALAQALLFIRSNFHATFTVTDLLQHVPLSRRRLEQLFQHHLGRSPKAEITRVRIEHARDLLARSDMFIPRVAENCGYTYPAGFSTAFKRATGLTPTAFRNQFRSRVGA